MLLLFETPAGYAIFKVCANFDCLTIYLECVIYHYYHVIENELLKRNSMLKMNRS